MFRIKLFSVALLTAALSIVGVFSVSSVFSQSTDTVQKTPTMKFNNYAYIFLGPDLDPKKDRESITTKNFTFTAVGIDFGQKEKVLEVAKEMVAQGAQTIELCGGFGPIWVAKVSEAINNQVPVGSVFYGPEARKPLMDLLSPVNEP